MHRSSEQPSSTFDWIASMAAAGVFATAQLGDSWDWPGSRWLGVACLALALPLFSLPFLHLSRYGASEPGKGFIHTTRVADRGLYAVVRHPQYLGYCLLVAGVASLSANPVSVTLSVLATIGFVAQAVAEERFLVRRMGDPYVDYMARVPRFDLVRGLWRWWRSRRGARANGSAGSR
ncbi:MAG: isoprenylcysteine carboxylmethyltransferase family protein [Gemmatimonadota bacterium]|jgi:protein-S-isoprenylcysteine O-methyltransferase Ste14